MSEQNHRPYIEHYPRRLVARVTIQFSTPFLVASGRHSAEADATPVLDQNGLPALPGSTLAGVLRHGFEEAHGEKAAGDFFGDAEAAGSRLWLSWGHLHHQGDAPVDGLLPDGPDPNDAVLQSAATTAVRDHVRIGHRGAVDERGKFDQAVVPAGHRFTFDLLLEATADKTDDEHFRWLLGYLASGRPRIGGSGRRGLGAFELVRCAQGDFDLTDLAGARAFCALPTRLDQSAPGLKNTALPQKLPDDKAWRTLRLLLVAEDYWAFHGTEPWLSDKELKHNDRVEENNNGENAGAKVKPPDFNPLREARVVWDENSKTPGSVDEPRLLVPGSSLKGPLAHRVAFHHNRFAGRFSQEGQTAKAVAELAGQQNPAVRELFGAAHDRRPDEDQNNGAKPPEESRAGRVYIDDVWLPKLDKLTLQRLMHNSQDRFTGGVRGGVLFEERVLYGAPTLELVLRLHRGEELSAESRQALGEALRDLCEGRLALGAGAGRGHGFFALAEGSDFEAIWAAFDGEAQR